MEKEFFILKTTQGHDADVKIEFHANPVQKLNEDGKLRRVYKKDLDQNSDVLCKNKVNVVRIMAPVYGSQGEISHYHSVELRAQEIINLGQFLFNLTDPEFFAPDEYNFI